MNARPSVMAASRLAARPSIAALRRARALLLAPPPALAQIEIKLGHVGEPGLAVPEERRRVRQARQRQARRQGQGRRLRLEPARQRQGDDAEAQARHARHGAAVDGDELARSISSASSRCPISSRTARTWAASRRRSSGRSSRPRPRRRASRSSRCGRTAIATSPTASGRSRSRPISQGIKLRVPEGKWRVKMFQAYGANPSPMKFSELFTALQTGVMDGAGESVHADLLGEAAGSAEVPVAVGPRLHAGVPDRRQDASGNRCRPTCARSSRTRRRRRRPTSTRSPRRTTPTLLGKLKQAGMQVNDVDKDAFVAASKPIYEEFGKEVPGAKEVIDRAVALRQVSAAPAHACQRRRGRRDGDGAGSARATAALLEWLVIALMVVLAVEVTLGVVFRVVRPLAQLVRRGRLGAARLAHVLRLGARVGQARAHRLPGGRRRCCRGGRGARSTIVAQVLVIAFFALLGGVGVMDPADARHRHAGEPAWIPMSVVQSVIPISSVLIVVAELTHLVDLARRPGTARRRRVGIVAVRRPALSATQRAMTIMLGLFGAVLALVLINVPIAVSLGDRRARRDGRRPTASRSLPNLAARHLQRRDQLPAARDPAVHPRRRDHERVGHLAPADRVRVVAVRLDARRPRARVDRRVDVLRRDLGLGGRRRRRARLDPDPGDEGEGLSGAARRRGDVVGGDARGDHPAVDSDDPLRGDGRDLGRAALRRRHRARASSAASA